MARRVIDWPLDRPATVFGGLTFGGGPIGNYMSHAVASMSDKLRVEGGTGLLFANGGFATHNHSIVISAEPIAAAEFPRDYDFQAEADAARRVIPELDRDYVGPAKIETYTVFHHRDGTSRGGVIVARTPSGARTLARVHSEDVETLRLLTQPDEMPAGRRGVISRGEPLRSWRFG
jgi:acetyl-CoA C-acetyltransferase